MRAIHAFRRLRTTAILALSAWLASAAGFAQTIGLNQTVIADFNSVAEFQSLSNAGWIFRAGNGVGTQTCASPGNISLCGFGFAQDGASGAARGLAAGNTQGRWIITPPILFGASGSIRVTLRKAASGTGGLDVRESDGASDTQDMSENEVPAGGETRGSGACPVGNSFCALRNLRSSGAATSGGEPSCASLFDPANPGIGVGYCTVEIRAGELQNFGTGVHRIAIKLRSAGSTAGSNQDVLVDRIEIRTGNNDLLAEQAWVSHGFTGSTPPIGLYRHPVTGHTSANLTLVGSQASVDEAAMAFSPDGNTLYAIVGTAPGQLVRIDPLSGSRTPIGPVSGLLSGNEFVRGLMIDPRSGAASLMTRSFADTQSRLYTLNLANGEADLQAGVNAGGTFRASASAIDCEGRLYSVETSSPGGIGARLYRVDRANGSVTLIGNTGYNSSLFHGPIAFNHRTRQLMGWVQATSGAYVGYGSYNLSTGAFTTLSTTPQLTPGGGAINARCWNGFANGFEP
ncbi:MAG: hypothetical protein MUE46_10375 [Xanthomonadales bacterium]|jgi:hypothetical protein|nr:hypothetical protein [Xanthomonadales bacterium]